MHSATGQTQTQNTKCKVTAQAEKERVGMGESPPEEATRCEQSGNQKRDVQRQDGILILETPRGLE